MVARPRSNRRERTWATTAAFGKPRRRHASLRGDLKVEGRPSNGRPSTFSRQDFLAARSQSRECARLNSGDNFVERNVLGLLRGAVEEFDAPFRNFLTDGYAEGDAD